MENITSFDKFDGNSTIDLHVYISPIVKLIAFFACSWIIIAHSFIIFCFIVHRPQPWTNYSKQILSLSLNDLLVGFTCFFLLIEFSIEVQISYIACSLSFYFFFAAICASLYHVFAICIYRAFTLIREPAYTSVTSVKLSVLLVLLAWIASFCLSAVPFIFWDQPRQDVPGCRYDFVFGDQRQTAVGFFAICYILPILFTNIVYAITCCKLLVISRKTYPTIATETETATQNVIDNLTQSNNMSHSNRSGVQAQRKAIGTIGLLLLFFNLFTVPLVVIMCAVYSGITVPRSVRTLSSIVFTLNSVISPFVYAFRTKFLRIAMKDLVNDCMSGVCV